ncbi:MAG: 3-phosphoserine/phosphohydroxythreonine transaminase [Polyangiales bacterium]|nr:3-phosphoserine/phosphohydroxythreonine transaminase [Sandaracinaceae bacterium]
MSRVVNFNAGPATLPLSALEHTRDELLDFEGTGMSILEHSHRGGAYMRVHEECKVLLRELLAIPDTHEVIFMGGGASTQFALIPMNLAGGGSADYVDTGTWSAGAMAEANVVATGRLAGTGKEGDKYVRVPKQADLDLDPNAAYVHITSNNTVMGSQYHTYPDTGSVPLVADMSSDILWRPTDVSKFGLIYAGAQKNLGPAGVTVVIVRKDLAAKSPKSIPKIFRYSTMVDKDSMANTVPTFPVYMVRNVLRWVKAQGGAAAMETRNLAKAKMLYDILDANDFYKLTIEKDSRSVMNPVFNLPTETLEKKLVADAGAAGFAGIKGHRSVGGLRISMYNAMEPENVAKFCEFLTGWTKQNS